MVVVIIRYIVSDCDAVSLVYDEQGYANSPEEAVADVIKAGMVLVFSLLVYLSYPPILVFSVGLEVHI